MCTLLSVLSKTEPLAEAWAWAQAAKAMDQGAVVQPELLPECAPFLVAPGPAVIWHCAYAYHQKAAYVLNAVFRALMHCNLAWIFLRR